ncbi:hypothetical protein JTB14_010674 [Gonioctena quinquepunctata]|nr:hypothetical protein JTB14_010674 [Gonioctena quinquepunctata]
MKFSQLQVVVWKNFIIRRRHWLLTIFESLLPIVLFVLIAYGRSKITGLNKMEILDPTYSDVQNIPKDIDIGSTYLFYAPENKLTSSVMRKTSNKFSMPSDRVFGFKTEKEMLEHYYKNHNSTVFATIFNGSDPKKFIYTIRYHEQGTYYENVISTEERYTLAFNQFIPGRASDYIWKHLISMQETLDLSFIEYSLNTSDVDKKVSLEIEEFPYPPYVMDTALTTLFMDFLPLLTLFSFIFLCPAVLKRVVEEKHSGIKELMKMVGMKSWMLWLGWFIYGMVPVIISISAIVFLMKVPLFGTEYPPIEHSSSGVLFLFLLFYCMASITFCFAISSCFSKPTTAMVTGILVWILSYFVPKYAFNLEKSNQLSWPVNVLLNILPNMVLHYGYTAISVYEERGIGIQWDNFYKSSSGGQDDVTMLNIFLMLWFDMLLFILFTFYMDNVNPGKYGVRKSFLFPIHNLREWLRQTKGSKNVGVDYESVHLENVEEGRGMNKGIEIRQLYKRYGPKLAVNNLNLDVYKNQITVLLGHNGAGKSTTMSMITGMLEVSSGSIKINGLNIKNSMDKIRQNLGLCPQHNLFFTDLTVREHLIFFAKLKGKTSDEASAEADKLLKELNLHEKKNVLPDTLSGGMKRKLCLGMSLVGGSNVLILDEPSSGMDPESRRQLWDLLLSWRGEKTILITTHFMEEADALGDWIAIMANGALQCYGTPMFLKKRYDTGYHLSLIVKGGITKNEKSAIKREVEKQIPEAHLKSQDGNNLVFILPFDKNADLSNLLVALENRKGELKIDNIAVTVTTLEDVFLRAKVESDGREEDQIDSSLFNTETNYNPENIDRRRIVTLFHKRVQFLTKKKFAYLIPFLIAVVFFCLTVYLTSNKNSQFSDNGPKLEVSLRAYGASTAFYNGTEGNSQVELLKKYYTQKVEEQGSRAFEVSDVDEAIILKGRENIAYFKEHMIASVNFFHRDSVIIARALYNNIAIHSLPISLNLVTNAIAQTLLGGEYSISASYWPLKSVNVNDSPKEYSQTSVAVLWLIMIPIGCLFIHGSFIIFPHTEISTRFIQLQYMCGVKPFVYWLTNFFSDFLIYISMIFPLVMIMCLGSPPFRQIYEFIYLFIILIFYGLCGIPFTYLFSRKSSASGAFALFVILGIFLGIIVALVIGVLFESKIDYYMNIGQTIKVLGFLSIPQVALTSSILDFSRRVVEVYNLEVVPKRIQSSCSYEPSSHPCCSETSDECLSFKSYGNLLKTNLLLMLGSCVIYLTVNILLDSYLFRKMCAKVWYYLVSMFFKSRYVHEDNVSSQRNNQVKGKEKYNTLRANKLSKTYSGKQIVKNIDFTLNNAECLGILGVNGAGKTTTFRMLTREEIVDNGQIHMKLKGEESEIGIDEDRYMETLGYCPQADTLNYILTGRQILTTIAQLRGTNDTEEVDTFLKLFDLEKYADQPCGYYSGGNKRKLSLAVSLIGYRKFVLLDEPTNGVDPSSRRKCWNLVKGVQEQKGLSFILTSHSMAECEALCNNLMIMKEGRFVEEGSLSELKNKFGGFTLKLKLLKQNSVGMDEVDCAGQQKALEFDNVEDLKEYFMKDARGELKDEHAGMLHFYIKDDNMKWSDIFKEVEEIKAKNPHLIEDYAISEASLEDVFLKVARSDENRDDSHNKKHKL